MLIEFTAVATGQPVAVNPDHVESIEDVMAVPESVDGGEIEPHPATSITCISGAVHLVNESYETVLRAIDRD